MRINGTILSAGGAQGLILGDDDRRYTFTPLGWRDNAAAPEVGMTVEFESRGSHAVNVMPLSVAAPSAPTRTATSPASPPRSTVRSHPVSGASRKPPVSGTATSPVAPQSMQPQENRFGSNRGRQALAILGMLVVVGLIGAVLVLSPWSEGSSKRVGTSPFRLALDPRIDDGDEIVVGGSRNLAVQVNAREQGRGFFGLFGEKPKRVGISVSFPSATEGRSEAGFSSDADVRSTVADVKAWSSGSVKSDISFYGPRSSSVGRQFAGDYVQVESDAVAVLSEIEKGVGFRLFISTRRVGELPILIRGWVCANAYSQCWRQSADAVEDREAYFERQLTVNVTADEGLIAYNQREDGFDEIFVVAVRGGDDIDLGSRIRLTDNFADDTGPDFSPDGKKIVFQSNRNDPNPDDDTDIWDLYVMNVDGSGVKRLTKRPSSDITPSWSPDGRRIAYASGGSEKSAIYVMNADGSGVTQLTDNSARDRNPSWSPDGRRIAFGRSGSVRASICVTTFLDDRWSDPNCPVSGWSPSWSPSADRIAYVAVGRSGLATTNIDIFVMNPSGTSVSKLASKTSADYHPSWSSDGRRVVFVGMRDATSFVDDEHDMYVVNADGSKFEGGSTVVELGTNGYNPSWSPVLTGAQAVNT